MNNGRTIWPALVAACLTLWASGHAPAAELRFIEVDRDSDRNLYSLKSISWFETEPAALYHVLTDYEFFHRFTSAITESRNLEPDEQGRPRYFTRMQGCVLLFCKSFIRIGYLELDPISEIVAETNPEESDFERARERWQLIPEGDGTVMIYEFEMVPDFWVPPVIGPYYLKQALKSGGARAVERIEALALGKEPPP